MKEWLTRCRCEGSGEEIFFDRAGRLYEQDPLRSETFLPTAFFVYDEYRFRPVFLLGPEYVRVGRYSPEDDVIVEIYDSPIFER